MTLRLNLRGIQRMPGFDASGEVHIIDDRIIRGIYPERAREVREVLAACVEHDLFGAGVVSTRATDVLSSDSRFALALEHKAVPFISYAHEWSRSALRDAALFHIELFDQLIEKGLALKDWNPSNILFDGTRPVFVDFTSLVPVGALPREPYLQTQTAPRLGGRWRAFEKALFETYRRMFLPHFLLPLYMIDSGKSELARKLMFSSALNTGTSGLRRRDVLSVLNGSLPKHVWRDISRRRLLNRPEGRRHFLDSLKDEVSRLSIGKEESDYADYYRAKGEDFDLDNTAQWRPKQRSIAEILGRIRPATLLDVGSNTGWFSMLAARKGAVVVAVDTDEASVDRLYERAKAERAPILPLVLDLTRPLSDVWPDDDKDHSGDPMILNVSRRLRCDTVLALGLLHHLVLGRGLTTRDAVARLAGYAERRLIVEFVSIGDPLVRSEPSFFPAMNAGSADPTFTRDTVVAECSRHFRHTRLFPSHPGTRTVIFCEEKLAVTN